MMNELKKKQKMQWTYESIVLNICSLYIQYIESYANTNE